MATKQQGEIAIEVEGKTYTLRPSMNAMCIAEDAMEKALGREISTAEIFALCDRGNMRALRIVLWSYLQAKHAKDFDVPEKVGSLIIDVVGIDAVTKQLQKLMEINEPTKEQRRTTTGGNPPEAQAEAGSGENSSLPRAVSA